MRPASPVLVLLAAGLVLAGCGGSDNQADPAPASSSSPAPEGSAAPSEGDAFSTVPGAVGSMVVATDSDLGGIWDPHKTASPFATPILKPVYEPLIRFSPEGLQPGIASSWEFDDAGTSFELKLTPGVTFSDGTPLDAAAVVANIERAKTVQDSSLTSTLEFVTAVEAVDPETVKMTLANPNAALPGLLADRPGMMISPAAFDKPDLDLLGVGAGPYVLAKNEPGVVAELVANPDYYDAELPRVEELTVRILDPDAEKNAFLDGELDVIQEVGDDRATFESDGKTVKTYAGSETQIMYLNKTDELKDPAVRQAISLAVDREGISEALTGGRCTPTAQLYGPGLAGHVEDYPKPEYDPDRAATMIADAGAEGLQLDMVTFPADQQAETLVPMLEQIGVTLKVEKVAPPELTTLFSTGKRDAYYTRLSGAVDPSVIYDTLAGRFNPGDYAVPEVTALAAKANSATDADERRGIYQDINTEMSDLAWAVPICTTATEVATDDDVASFQLDVLGNVDFYSLQMKG